MGEVEILAALIAEAAYEQPGSFFPSELNLTLAAGRFPCRLFLRLKPQFIFGSQNKRQECPAVTSKLNLV